MAQISHHKEMILVVGVLILHLLLMEAGPIYKIKMSTVNIETQLLKMRHRALEFAQARSSFQIEKFIGCDEHTPVTRYRHLAHNSFVTLKATKQAVLQRERAHLQLERLEKKRASWVRWLRVSALGPDDLDVQIAALREQVEDLDVQIKGGLAEVDVFEKLCDELEKQNGGPFTYAQLEAEEPERWHKQLAAQAYQNVLARSIGVGEGNVNAMLCAAEPSILPDGKNVSSAFDFQPHALAAAADAHVGKKQLPSGSP